MAGFRNIVQQGGGGNIPDGAAVLTDSATRIIVVQETNAAQTEAIAFIKTVAESNAAQSESITFIPPGALDTNVAQSETITRTTNTWATTQTTSGTAPVNPANALGAVDGTLATVKAGGLANGTSTLTNTIPVASVPAGTRLMRLYYQTNAGAADTFTMSFTNTGGSPASGTLPTGNFLATPYDLAITTLGTAFTVTFTHAAIVPVAGGSITVDATGIRTT